MWPYVAVHVCVCDFMFVSHPSSPCSELSGKELVAEMVYSFLLPEVEKKTMRQRGGWVDVGSWSVMSYCIINIVYEYACMYTIGLYLLCTCSNGYNPFLYVHTQCSLHYI